MKKFFALLALSIAFIPATFAQQKGVNHSNPKESFEIKATIHYPNPEMPGRGYSVIKILDEEYKVVGATDSIEQYLTDAKLKYRSMGVFKSSSVTIRAHFAFREVKPLPGMRGFLKKVIEVENKPEFKFLTRR